MGRDYDINKDIYPALQKMTMEELKMFFNQNIKGIVYLCGVFPHCYNSKSA